MELTVKVEFGYAANQFFMAWAKWLNEGGPARLAEALRPVRATEMGARGLQPPPDAPDPPAGKKEDDVRASGHEQDSPAGLSRPADGGGGNNEMLSPDPTPCLDVSSLNSPAAAMPPLALLGARKWSEERCRRMAELKAEGKTFRQMLPVLNKLPGQKISSHTAIEQQYGKMKKAGTLPKVKAAEAVAKAAPRPAPAPARAVAATDLKTPVKARIAEIEQWAASRGLCNGVNARLDMDAVNAKRRELGQPPFELVRKPA
jgi:hypothetical protein